VLHGVVICRERGADLQLRMSQLMPLPLTLSCFSKIHIGFTFLVPAHLDIPGKRAVKRVYVCWRQLTFLVITRLQFSRLSTIHITQQQQQQTGAGNTRVQSTLLKLYLCEEYDVVTAMTEVLPPCCMRWPKQMNENTKESGLEIASDQRMCKIS